MARPVGKYFAPVIKKLIEARKNEQIFVDQKLKMDLKMQLMQIAQGMPVEKVGVQHVGEGIKNSWLTAWEGLWAQYKYAFALVPTAMIVFVVVMQISKLPVFMGSRVVVPVVDMSQQASMESGTEDGNSDSGALAAQDSSFAENGLSEQDSALMLQANQPRQEGQANIFAAEPSIKTFPGYMVMPKALREKYGYTQTDADVNAVRAGGSGENEATVYSDYSVPAANQVLEKSIQSVPTVTTAAPVVTAAPVTGGSTVTDGSQPTGGVQTVTGAAQTVTGTTPIVAAPQQVQSTQSDFEWKVVQYPETRSGTGTTTAIPTTVAPATVTPTIVTPTPVTPAKSTVSPNTPVNNSQNPVVTNPAQSVTSPVIIPPAVLKTYTIEYQARLADTLKNLLENQVIYPLTSGRSVIMVKVVPVSDVSVLVDIYYGDGSQFSSLYSYNALSGTWSKHEVETRTQTTSSSIINTGAVRSAVSAAQTISVPVTGPVTIPTTYYGR